MRFIITYAFGVVFCTFDTIGKDMYKHFKNSMRGFTIVELLIVIVVIAILAAITIVAYNGVQKNATASMMKETLRQAATKMTTDAVATESYAATLPSGISTPSGIGLALATVATSKEFCINVKSQKFTDLQWYIDQTQQLKDGLCPGAVILASIVGDYMATVPPLPTNGGVVTTVSTSIGDGRGLAVTSTGKVLLGTSGTGSTKVWDVLPGSASTFAGSGSQGDANGTGAAATFWTVSGMGIDVNDNIYVLQCNHAYIRKVTPAGVVTTITGSASNTFMDGPLNVAKFACPGAIDASPSGQELYVADTSNHRIRKIDFTTGIVSTLAGSGVSGYVNGIGTAAQFKSPYGIAVDPTNTYVYVTDDGAADIRRITIATGEVSTIAGTGVNGYANGLCSEAQFSMSRGDIDVDREGNLYLADGSNNAIRKITFSPNCTVTTLAGSTTAGYVNGTGAAARFKYPRSIDVDYNGVVYVYDYDNNRVRKIE